MKFLTLLEILADGKFHSGNEMGQELGVSRAAIWKTLQKVRKTGIDIHSVKGKGYRLGRKLELLKQDLILKELSETDIAALQQLEILLSVDSTNNLAMRKLQEANLNLQDGRVYICLSEQQTDGKGRRGRVWQSPFGCNIYFSLIREFDSGVARLEGLSLAVAVATVRAMEECGISGVAVKWPNDLLWQSRKLGGILLEMKGDVAGVCQVIIGIGINISASVEQMKEVDQAWVNAETITGTHVSRNLLAGKITKHLLNAIRQFDESGFAGFKQEWESLDAFRECAIEVSNAGKEQKIKGISKGVTDTGALKVETRQGLRIFNGGEVRLKSSI